MKNLSMGRNEIKLKKLSIYFVYRWSKNDRNDDVSLIFNWYTIHAWFNSIKYMAARKWPVAIHFRSKELFIPWKIYITWTERQFFFFLFLVYLFVHVFPTLETFNTRGINRIGVCLSSDSFWDATVKWIT